MAKPFERQHLAELHRLHGNIADRWIVSIADRVKGWLRAKRQTLSHRPSVVDWGPKRNHSRTELRTREARAVC